MELPFEPPLNIQMVYSHLMTDKTAGAGWVVVGDGAVGDGDGSARPPVRSTTGTDTARVMARLESEVETAVPETIDALLRFNAEEALAARSDARSVQTAYTRYDGTYWRTRA